MSLKNFKIRIATERDVIAQTERFAIAENKITLLFGESGIGKSLLSRAIYGLLDDSGLHITLNDKPYENFFQDEWLQSIQRHGFFVFQEPSSHLNPVKKLREQLSEGSLSDSALRDEDLRLLWDYPQQNTFKNLQQIYPQPFRPSGGEKQRLLLTMAIKKINLYLQNANAPETLFVFDEPTGSLDDDLRNRFLKLLLLKQRERPFSVLLITHDYSIISQIFNRHRSEVERFEFKELVRENDQVEMRVFDPVEYLRWIRQVKKNSGLGQKGGKPVLQVYHKFRVFGKEMRIFQNRVQPLPADLILHRGEIAYLKAASGVGKTTLAKLIMGLYRAERFNINLGRLKINQTTPSAVWRKKIWGRMAGMVFQHADEALDLQADVYHVFKGLPGVRLNKTSLLRELQTLFENRIDTDFLKRKVLYLSGGQKQRLNLLRTFLPKIDLIIMDEPLNGLDFASIRRVLQIIEEQRNTGTAILVISHNEEIFDAVIHPEKVYFLETVKT